MYKYEVILYWSNADGTYVAKVPELPGCMAHGPTQEAALRHAQEAIALWLDTARHASTATQSPNPRVSG